MLSAFTELRKATTSFVMSVCLSVQTELDSHRTDFHEILYLSIFRKTIAQIQVSLKSDMNEYFTWGPIYIYDYISLSSSKNETYFRQKL